MKITNTAIHGLAESIVASSLPMATSFDENVFRHECHCVQTLIDGDCYSSLTEEDTKRATKHLSRAWEKLGKWGPGEGHNCFEAGIIVQMVVTAPRYWWPQLQRYHFIDIISSTSTMHRLRPILKGIKEDEEKAYSLFSEQTSRSTIQNFLKLSAEIEEVENLTPPQKTEIIKANLPEGYLQTAMLTTNYRQLKTIHHQRQYHPLQEWREFCKWIEGLPFANELIIKQE